MCKSRKQKKVEEQGIRTREEQVRANEAFMSFLQDFLMPAALRREQAEEEYLKGTVEPYVREWLGGREGLTPEQIAAQEEALGRYTEPYIQRFITGREGLPPEEIARQMAELEETTSRSYQQALQNVRRAVAARTRGAPSGLDPYLQLATEGARAETLARGRREILGENARLAIELMREAAGMGERLGAARAGVRGESARLGLAKGSARQPT